MYLNAFENGLIVRERYLSIDELPTVVLWSNDFQAQIQPNEAQIQPNQWRSAHWLWLVQKLRAPNS
jgi:hypothetical protein